MALNLPQDEIPTADAVALAVVAAAKVHGEDALLLDKPAANLRCRWTALEALKVYYAQVPKTALAVYCGVRTNAAQRLNLALKSVWWATEGQQAFNAACAALEEL